MIERGTKTQYIIDCSVAVKWFNQDDELDVDQSLHLLDALEQDRILLSAPDILSYELFNALYKGKRCKEQELILCLEKFAKLPLQLFAPEQAVLEQAIKIALSFSLTVYDSVYIALAKILSCQLITANPKCHLKIKDGSVISLKEFK